MIEGSANHHPGQGTANRRFFFRNAYIELLYLHDPTEARSELTKSTKLYDRLTSKGDSVSPFGIGFRPSTDADKQVPFPGWSYKSLYLPEGLEIHIDNSPVSEPMWFFISFGSRPDHLFLEKRQAMDHSSGFFEITSLCVVIPTPEEFSESAIIANRVEGVEIVRGETHLIQIGFDGERKGRWHDFQPILPAVFRW